MKVPCKDCEKRCVGCHCSCEEYLAYCKSKPPFKDNPYSNWARANQLRYLRWKLNKRH